MAFTVKALLFIQKIKDGKHPIAIRTTVNRKPVYKMTGYWATKLQFEDGKLNASYPDYRTVNRAILQQVAEQERKFSLALAAGESISVETVRPKTESNISIVDFIKKLQDDLKHKFSDGILRHYGVVGGKMADYDPKITFSKISAEWMQGFERHLREKKDQYGRSVTNNTIQNNMKILKSILHKAAEQGIIEKSKFNKYKMPRYVQPIPEYLTETEITLIEANLRTLAPGPAKTCGYYFLLSCYTGYRISDAKRFNYNDHVQDGTIVLRTKKNKSVVSIPVHDRLKEVLEFVRSNPMTLSEQKVREYVKIVCKNVGITKYVKYHTSRHSWAMLLMNSGFSQEEVAETLGDTVEVARIYARISSERLNDKIMSKLNKVKEQVEIA